MSIVTRISTTVALFTIGAAPVVAQPAKAVPLTAAQKVHVAFGAAPDVSVRLMGGFATLRVTAWAHDSVALVGAIPKDARFERAIGDRVDGHVRGAKMFIETPDTRAPAAGTLELFVPARARVWVKAGTGVVEATGVTGELDINVLGGTVRVTGNPRVLHVEAIEAAVTVDGTPEWARLKTAEGDITLRGGGNDIGMTTVSGAVRVSDGTLERARIETVSGRITFAAALARGANIAIDTHSGPVDAQLDANAGAEITATTMAGSIENHITARAPTLGRDGRGYEIALSIGAGTGRITIGTYKGSIRLARR